MRKGADYSVKADNWTAFGNALKEAGLDFVGRYLWHGQKGATIEEVQALRALGIEIFFYYESYEGRALEGEEAGRTDAQKALSLLSELNAPDLPIIMTVDTDTLADNVLPYFRGAREILGMKRMGAYGGYKVIKGLFDEGLITYAVQTEAWSYLHGHWPNPPVWDERAQIHQWTAHATDHGQLVIRGVPCDALDAVADDFGHWRADTRTNPDLPPPPAVQRTLKVTSPLMHGDDVTWVQEKLCAIELTVQIDGKYGKNTAKAISKFQERKNLLVDGICGSKTWAKLVQA